MVPRRRFELLRAFAHHPLKMACLPDSTTSAILVRDKHVTGLLRVITPLLKCSPLEGHRFWAQKIYNVGVVFPQAPRAYTLISVFLFDFFLILAGVAGLEPAACGFGDRCSTKLSYTPTLYIFFWYPWGDLNARHAV